jgi:uncharacterized coiled-coil DUF342 family protein
MTQKTFILLLLCFVTAKAHVLAQQISNDSLQVLQARQEALQKASELNKLKITLAHKQRDAQRMKEKTDHFNAKANDFLSKAKKYSEELKQHPADRKAAKKSKKFSRRANHYTRKANRFSNKYNSLKNDIQSLEKQIQDMQQQIQQDNLRIHFQQPSSSS